MFSRGFRNRDDSEDSEDIERRFHELADQTPELGGLGPRDWSPAEDTSGFVAPDPPLPKLSRRKKLGWTLLVISLVGLLLLAVFHPAYSAALSVVSLVGFAASLLLLLPLGFPKA